jgi:molecular chaperone GrpE
MTEEQITNIEEENVAAEAASYLEKEAELPKEEQKEHKRPFRKSKKEDPSELKIKELEDALKQKDDQMLRLHAEFDNYRKRTLKEKMEMIKSAGEGILVNILPVVDDFERALQSVETSKDPEAIKEGINLIYKRFSDFLKQNGVKEIEAKELDFDTDLHEALTKIPAPTEELKGKVVDVIQKGYSLNDKVIRFAKVVIGE